MLPRCLLQAHQAKLPRVDVARSRLTFPKDLPVLDCGCSERTPPPTGGVQPRTVQAQGSGGQGAPGRPPALRSSEKALVFELPGKVNR